MSDKAYQIYLACLIAYLLFLAFVLVCECVRAKPDGIQILDDYESRRSRK
jgi:hypothetical protein